MIFLRPEQTCPSEICANTEAELARTCRALGKRPGESVMVRAGDGWCFCDCPSAPLGRGVIAASDGTQIPLSLAKGGCVLAAGRSGRFGPAVLAFVRKAGPKRRENTVLLRYRAGGLDLAQAVPIETPLLLYGGEIVAAGRLSRDDELLDANGNGVEITGLTWGAFDGLDYDCATMLSPPDPELSERFQLRDGIAVGDFSLRLYCPGLGGFGQSSRERPVLGTERWDRVNRGDGRGTQAPRAIDLDSGTFFPAAFATTDIPDFAITEHPLRSGTRRDAASRAETIEDQRPLHRVEHLLRHALGPRYPGVNFVLDWYETAAEAHLWRDEDGVHIVVSGGLARQAEAELPDIVARLVRRQER